VQEGDFSFAKQSSANLSLAMLSRTTHCDGHFGVSVTGRTSSVAKASNVAHRFQGLLAMHRVGALEKKSKPCKHSEHVPAADHGFAGRIDQLGSMDHSDRSIRPRKGRVRDRNVKPEWGDAVSAQPPALEHQLYQPPSLRVLRSACRCSRHTRTRKSELSQAPVDACGFARHRE
jgi:hypothetical protein